MRSAPAANACDFAARNHLGLGVAFAPFDVMRKATQYYREQCAQYGWQPTPEQILYRANILIAETDAEADELLQKQRSGGAAAFPMRQGVREALIKLDRRNIAGEARAGQCRRHLADNFLRRPGYGRRPDQALPRGERGRRHRSGVPDPRRR